MRSLLLLLALAACGEVHQVNRWPTHRREKDEQITTLTQSSTELAARIRSLEERIRVLETQIGKLSQPQPAPAQPAPPAVPSPGT